MIRTGVNVGNFGFEADISAQMKAIKDAGFSTVFTGFRRPEEELDQIANECAKLGLEFESLHAPWGGIGAIWEEGEKGDAWIPKQKKYLDICKKYGIGYLTMHCMNVPQYNNNGPVGNKFSEIGAKRFAEIVAYAADLGLKAAFETVEFPQLELKSLMDWFRAEGITNGLGVIWDIGHWNCYPSGLDFADTFGDLIIGTHTHDNFGNKNPQVITWDDDWHILPFDGTINWLEVGDNMKRSHFQGTISLELGRNGRMPWYKEYPSLEAFLAVLQERASHIARLCE